LLIGLTTRCEEVAMQNLYFLNDAVSIDIFSKDESSVTQYN
jgi:hypothetical protein